MKEETTSSPTAPKKGVPLPQGSLVSVSELLPQNLFLVPVAQATFFPGMVVPLILPEGKLSKTIDEVMEKGGHVGVVLSRHLQDGALAHGPNTSMTGLPVVGSVASGKPHQGKANGDRDLFKFGVASKVLKKLNLPDNQVSVLLSGLQRFEIDTITHREPHFIAKVTYLYEELVRDTELEAMVRTALNQFKQISKDNPLVSEEVKVALVNIDGPGKLADFMASVLIRDVQDYQKFLAAPDVKERFQQLLIFLKRERDVLLMQKKIQDDINEKIASHQKEFYLQEQLKTIQKELGRYADERTKVAEKFRQRLVGKKVPPAAQERIDEEMERLQSMHEQSSEYSVTLNYLDWITSLPWGVKSKENYSLTRAKAILNHDHFGLKDVKERILEFLAVRKLKQNSEGSIVCFVGPPGTGKTSLGKSIARVLDRKFFRFSVGGMRDEAEIKGHRKTYVGAMPGKLIQGLKRAGTQNPVFLIDEIDKIGSSLGTGGDPASALLELLDPEQNAEFLDHYLDTPFDCSDVFFITTANTIESIPPALLDRMEIISLHGYTDHEKISIAREYLIPKQLKKNGLSGSAVKISDRALSHIVSRYAREAGVRNLEKYLARILRKSAFKIASGGKKRISVTTIKDVEKLLGLPPFSPDEEWKDMGNGVAVGLAWTSYGGDVLQIESLSVPGKGGMVLTGTLGKVMQESANIAYTYIREKAQDLRLPRNYFEKNVMHVHVPSGATPKDGPSAGVTLAASLYSLLLQKRFPEGVAMTGELTLSGKVLPVGGIKEKLLAAKRSGIKTVIVPKQNLRDVKEVDRDVKKGLQIRSISRMDEGLKILFR